MSAQFDTFDNVADRREMVILFQRLGCDMPEPQARAVRARWLESLIVDSISGLSAAPLSINPDACHPVGAYYLFVQIVGVLGVPIQEAARALDKFVSQRGWHHPQPQPQQCELAAS